MGRDSPGYSIIEDKFILIWMAGQLQDTMIPLPAGSFWRKIVEVIDRRKKPYLYALAETGGERYAKLAELYAAHFLDGEPYPAWALDVTFQE